MSANSVRVPLVLVVDDDDMTRLLAREALEAQGLRVEEAADGAAGLEAFQRLQPELVLLDVNMPGMDGFESCRRLRALPGGERAPVMILTGQDDDGSIDRAYQAGATDFMPKPIHVTILGHRVRYLLRASRSLERLALSEASLASAQELARVGNWEWRPGAEAGYWSGEMYRILGLDPKKDRPCLESLLRWVPEDEHTQVAAEFSALLRDGRKGSLEHRVRLPDGTERVVHHQAEAVRDGSGRSMLLRGTVQDVTERKQLECQIRMLAYYDSLTGLPNRVHFKERVARALRQAGRDSGQVAVMFIDLDRFKQINDSLGHPVGDGLLKQVAARLTRCLRGGDEVGRDGDAGDSTARLGGDEFTVLLTGLARAEDAARVAGRIVAELARPYLVDGHELFVSASVGIAIHPADGGDVDTLLKNADVAMYSAKALGRNTYQFYSREMNERALERLGLERDLHRALERGELLLHYQPQVDFSRSRVTGVEALLRWRHPERGLVPPAQFIPIAEQNGLIGPIGDWVLEEACRQAQQWGREGLDDLQVWVNVSGLQFRDRHLCDAVRGALERSGLEPGRLVLEATETIMVEDRDVTLAVLQELSQIGVGIALDDFGTGYSSLSYLKRFPLDTLKIDGSFVRDLDSDEGGRAIVEAIIALGRSLKLEVLAEGVETNRQAARLANMGCPRMQGYYFSRPLPAAEIRGFIGQAALRRPGTATLHLAASGASVSRG